MRFTRFAFLILIVAVFAGTSFSQSKRPMTNEKSSELAKASECISGTFSFECPEDYKVLLSGKTADRLFLAKSTEFRYAVFAVSDPSATTVTELLPLILKAFLPNESQEFEWKDVEADLRKSSMFEVESKRRIGMNGGKAYLTLEYRQIDFNGKKLLTGTIVNGYEGPVGIRESFQEGVYTTNGGCFDSVDIIAAFTGENLDPEQGPCFFTITISPGL